MATELQTRAGADEVQWDLTDLYTGPEDQAFTSELENAISGAEAFKDKYYGRIGELGADELAPAVAELEELHSLIGRAGAYAYMRFSSDTSDPARGALLQKVQEQGTKFSTITLFTELEWVAVPDDKAERLLAEPVLANYRHWLESLRRYKPHVLSEPEEKIMTEKSVSSNSAWSRLFSELMSAVRIGPDEVPFEAAMAKLYSPDAELRKRTAAEITEALRPGLKTRAFIFNTLLHEKATNDRLRKYPTWISSRNLSNEASDEAVTALIDAVVSRYDIAQRYYRLKARLLGTDKIKDYDRYAPVTSDDTNVDWPEAKSLILEAYESFSPKAGAIIGEFFEKSWIDAAPTPNKTPGAYCMTTIPHHHPYMLMSYTGDRRSVLTLAHELGHGLHGYLAGKQTYFNANTPLTLAETASVFGEALTFGLLLGRESDPKKRLALIAGRMEDAIATVFRQIAMNRFEEAVHTARREKGELSVEDLGNYWFETQSVALGDAVEITDSYRESWWSYIPHFIGAPGYVYAYAFGYLFSLAIYQKYVQEGDSMIEPYFELLASGGSDRPEVLAKIVGLDLGDPNFWASGLEALDLVLAEAEELAKNV